MPQKLKISLGQRLRTHPLPRGGSDCVQAHFVSAMVMPQKSESRVGTVSRSKHISCQPWLCLKNQNLAWVQSARSKHISCQPWLCLKNQNLAWVQSAGPSTFRVSHGYASKIRISLGYSQPVQAHFVSAMVMPQKSESRLGTVSPVQAHFVSAIVMPQKSESRLGTVSRSKHISCQPWLCLKNQNLAWVQSAGPSTFRVSHGYASKIRISLGYSQPGPSTFRVSHGYASKIRISLGYSQNHLAVAGGCAAHSKHISCQPWLSLFNLHEEPFEFRRVRVRIDCGRRKMVRRHQRRFPFVFGNTAITPVNRQTDLVRLLTVDHHRLDSSRNHRATDVLPTSTRNSHVFTAADPHLVR